MRKIFGPGVLATLGLCACNASNASSNEAAQAKAALTPKLDQSCPILSASEVSALYGATVSDAPANSLPQATSCEFSAGGHTVVMISTMPGRYYEEHKTDGFKHLPGIGDQASVSDDLGWRAVARVGDKAALVATEGPGGTEDNAVAILKAVVAKGI